MSTEALRDELRHARSMYDAAVRASSDPANDPEVARLHDEVQSLVVQLLKKQPSPA